MNKQMKELMNKRIQELNIYIYNMDTTVDHFTPLALRVRGNEQTNSRTNEQTNE